MTPETRALLIAAAAVLATGVDLMSLEQLSQWRGVRAVIEQIDEVLAEDDQTMLTRLFTEPSQ